MHTDFSAYLAKIENTINSFLPQKSDLKWADSSFASSDPAITQTHFAQLLNPTHSLVALGGKRWRPLLVVLTAKALAQSQNLDEQKTQAVTQNAFLLTPLVEFVHTASLIHDDIEDSSDTRRGQPAAYITYGIDTALNAGSWLYFQAASCINALSASDKTKLALYEAYTSELRTLHLGQAMDIFWHKDKSELPGQNEYLAMVKSKTGTLSSLAVRIGCLASDADPAFSQKAASIASQIGAGFQIIDDVINLTSGNPGKIRGDDIVEEKKSLPVILFCEQNPARTDELIHLMNQAAREGVKSPAVEGAIQILEQSGCIKKARQIGTDLIHKSCGQLQELFNNVPASCEITSLFTSMIPEAAK